MKKITVEHGAYFFSHGKRARGKGCWVFAATKFPEFDDMYFCSAAEFGTVLQCAKIAAEKLNVTTVFVQP
tara:strand:- start:2255 stop:2464 length:210 start_codon:yes stop_codon:yes gene_type:complete